MLSRLGVGEVALTGAQALGVWTVPRSTADVDLCAVVPLKSVDRLLAQYDGIRVGPEEVPSIIRIQFRGWQVDLFVAKSEYDLHCLERAVATKIGEAEVRVVTPEDLIIHKLHKLKDDRRKLLQDAADLRLLATTLGPRLDLDYLRKWLEPSDAELASQLATLDEAELVRQLAAR
jgi:hypothetical protein